MRPSAFVITGLLFSAAAMAAPANRIQTAIDARQVRALPGGVHRLAQGQFDRGLADPAMRLDHVQLMIRPSDSQQAELDRLLADQQNPASPGYHQWLTPEQFGDRFGLTTSDQSKIVAWLTSQGLTVQESSRGRNWIAFSGTTAQISKALHTEIHRYSINNEMHFANASAPWVPSAVADLVAGFNGLHDFLPKSAARAVPIDGDPAYTAGKNHYLAPEDFSTIYNVAPLYQAGIDGTGQGIVVVGASAVSLADIRAFRARFGLPANDPKLLPYSTDPGLTGAQFEANLDLEWSGAIAPKATIYYVYGANAFTAVSAAVSANLAPVISVSFGYCEIDDSPFIFRTVAQQANAQGITWLNSSGDSGGASCDVQGYGPVATRGSSAAFPVNMPEVTGVGGTMFVEAGGTYWAGSNSPNGGSALSYIPEAVWNETAPGNGLLASGGGASRFFSKPDWQTGPGVPADGARDVPDISLSAALHDGYLVTLGNSLYISGGTSASAPSLAGIIALLNQYVVKQGFQKSPGLGNINPQLYRMAQTTPAAFHDITAGDNIVPCVQGSPDCLTGSVGYAAGPGYDQATGLGSIDANVFVTSWNKSTNPATITLTSSASRVTVNDTVTLTATVSGTGGTPTGTVTFLAFGVPLGSVQLPGGTGPQTVTYTANAWQLVATSTVVAQYAGDGAFSPASASARVQVTLPGVANVSAVVPTVTNPVYGFPSFTQPPTWQAFITLREVAGAPAVLTGFTVDGQAQSLAQYFPSPNIPASGTLSGNIVFRNLAVPVIRTFGFTGTDLSGQTWSRQIQVRFLAPHQESVRNFNLWANPLAMQQNTSAPASCQWSQQIVIDETQGFNLIMVAFFQGETSLTSKIASIFGTRRLPAWGSISGTLCWNGPTPPATDAVFAEFQDEFGNLIANEINVTFSGPAPAPVQLTASPASLAIKPSSVPGFQTGVTLSVGLSDRTQPWTATVFPANRTTSWLQLSQYSGTGPATISLAANGTGFEPGAYRATIVLQSPNSMPQWLAVPVMFVNGAFGGPTITSVSNALSFTPGASPGMLLAVFGSQLSGATQAATTLPLSFASKGVSATVNNWPAPILYVSPTQLNIQIPYEAGAGPAVLSVNNNGQIAGYQFTISQAAPGILSDGNGGALGTTTAKQGGFATVYVTGIGDVSPSLASGAAVPSGVTPANLPKPLLPVTVTVGGVPAFVQFAGATPGVVGLAQINIGIPATVPAGVQPVIVTAGGISSAPANITVTAAQ